jgi:glycosyltransferase involved in cell wall biosynthesis
MRVLLVHNYYCIRGGEDVVLEQELEILRAAGVDVRLFSVRNSEMRGLRAKMIAGLSTIYNPWARRKLAAEIAAFAPDVVHVHNFFPQLSPSIFDACRRAGVPSVMTLHNLRIADPRACYEMTVPDPDKPRRSPWAMVPQRVYRGSFCATLALVAMVEFHRWRGTWLTHVDRFIALSNSAKAMLVARGLPASKIVVKPNSVLKAERPPSQTARHGALFVGRLDEQKGVKTLLQAWKDIDYPLTIIGDGPLADLVAAAQNSKISFLGLQSRANVENAMRSSQLLVFPSLAHEMFPMTIAEAFANQLPVLASAIPSLRDVVSDGETGLLFSTGDAGSLAQCVTRAIRSVPELEALSRNAYEKYLESYTPEANAAALIRLYSSLAGAAQCGKDAQLRHAGQDDGLERAS